MFSKKITDSDKFLDLPLSTQALYFHLNMHADDDGFVDNTKTIKRMIGASDGDLRTLMEQAFILPFESGVIVIKDWRVHNYIPKDRYQKTIYTTEFNRLVLEENKSYTECIQNVYDMDTQIRLDKNRLDENRIEEVKKEESSTSSQNLKYFFEKWQEITGRALTPFEIEDIPKLHKEDGFSIELMLTALKEAANSTSNFNFNYFKSILMRYKRQGLLTPEMVAGAEKQRQEAKDKQYFKQQPAKSNVPDWVDEDFKHEASAEEQAQLDALKAAMMED